MHVTNHVAPIGFACHALLHYYFLRLITPQLIYMASLATAPTVLVCLLPPNHKYHGLHIDLKS